MTRSLHPAPLPDVPAILDAIGGRLDYADRQLEIAEMAYAPPRWGNNGKVSLVQLLKVHRDLQHVANCIASATNSLALTSQELHQQYTTRPDATVCDLARRELALRQRIERLAAPVLAGLVQAQSWIVVAVDAREAAPST